uniref:Ubiquitin-like protease family profile domain-containing protein n=1 Tax=Oryza barthii TaxID=65489 RepID=A0A0D3HKI9_9ORYZ
MTIDEKREFKAAFVLYVTTKFLAPQSCANFISPRYIRAVADVDNIKQYNWSQFVVDEVKKAAESLHKRFPNMTQQSINGCIIFLMAKYLSKLVIRKVGITSVKSCHISQFEDNQIAMMIQQDIDTFPRYGKLQIQCRGNDGGANLIKFLESHFNSLDVSAMVGPQAYEELKSYIQDGFNRIDEIFPSIADFVDISNLKTATEAANMFKKAFKYNMAAAVKIATRAVVRNVIDTIEDMQGPLHPWGDPSTMGYHTPTNYSTHATEYENPIPDTVITNLEPRSALLLNLMELQHKMAAKFLSIQDFTDATKHPGDYKDWEPNGFSDSLNLAIRIMFQQEVERFQNTNYLGWRHFINQDFGMYAVAGDEFWEANHQLAHFTGPEVVYDVSDSHMILIPVHLFKHYVLYVFNMESKKVSVLDSLNTQDPLGESRFTRHDKIKIMVSRCVMECMRLASPRWNKDILKWDFEAVENIPKQQNGDDCGFHVFNNMVNWDGLHLVNSTSQDPYYLRRQFLIHLLTLRDNEAILPEYVVHRLRHIKDN